MTSGGYQSMTFGKHKGLPVNEVGTEYLIWCYDNMTAIPHYILKELERRGLNFPHVWIANNEKPARKKRKIKTKRKAKKPPAVPKFVAEVVGRDYQQIDSKKGECPF